MNRLTAIALTTLLLLAACAEKWVKPGGTEEELDATNAVCGNKAMSQFPPMLRQVQITTGYTTPIYTNCTGYGYGATCMTTGGQYVAPVFITVDDNGANRTNARHSCLLAAGWQPDKS